ncbi:CinA family nicotinamide mononucleotide deamidase-related protein [Desulfoscipio gibsoniae]|uniref:Putative competence-damage inducible protein n=1 Tax=Desulfoscipio gibsoniae DSM 7213 TaxID=767817 RepID=R4KCJ7_9FIRM|nr:CinA family nicotinamide mononucleotide deamidase-related protein [Desulfoscipio gibsoniae]AGL00299.1 competence/damage-inducible protein CinA-like protein [Desulfoscipio gibsoniae DSM 7213]
MICEIIFTGTELLLGQILNTNAQVIERELSTLGIDLYYQVTVGDNLQRCAAAIKQAAGRADLIIVGGGLGPTEDDISREALAEALQLELVQDEKALEVVRRFFDRRGIPLTLNNLKQALVPAGGRAIDNPIGTAPGIIVEQAGKTYILVPGPPSEFNMMVKEQVIPYLIGRLASQVGVIKSRVLKFCGIGESLLDEKLSDLLKSTNPTIAPTAKFSEIHLRLTAKARQSDMAEEMIDAMESRVRERLGAFIFGVDDETLPGAVTLVLREQGKTIAVAENFTGGQLSYQLSSAAGAESTFTAGLVARDYRQLQEKACLQLGDIPTRAMERAGHMASMVRKQFGTDIGAAVAVQRSGGDDAAVAEYNLYIAADCNGRLMMKKVLWSGERDEMAKRASTVALVLLWRYLKHGIPF